MHSTYSPLFGVPSGVPGGDSPVLLDYGLMKSRAARLGYYTKFRVSTDVALALAGMSPYPDGVKLGVMKQVANTREVTLEQMRILLGWAARKAQEAAKR